MNQSITVFITSLTIVASILVSGSAFAGNNRFSATLTGDQLRVAVNTPAIGKARVKFDQGYTKLDVTISIKNLIGSIQGGQGIYLQCGRPGERGPALATLVNSTTFEGNRIKVTLTNDNLLPLYCGPDSLPVFNVASLAFAMRQGYIYVKVYTQGFSDGEIRGQLE